MANITVCVYSFPCCKNLRYARQSQLRVEIGLSAVPSFARLMPEAVFRRLRAE
jgi:hypothetical protein